MNEKTLLVLCYLIAIVCILPFRKRLSKRWFVLSILLVPLAVYVLLKMLFVAIALFFGDK